MRNSNSLGKWNQNRRKKEDNKTSKTSVRIVSLWKNSNEGGIMAAQQNGGTLEPKKKKSPTRTKRIRAAYPLQKKPASRQKKTATKKT